MIDAPRVSRYASPPVRTADADRLRRLLAGASPARPRASDAKLAAVACVLRDRAGEVEVLLIRRAEREGDQWSGHMAFPGGRAEPHDRDLRETAERETREEVGLDLSAHGDPWGPLEEHRPRVARGLVVAPYVWWLRSPDAPLAPNVEVAETLWAPIGPMMRGETATTYALKWHGLPIKMPGYQVGDHVVWGMTHRMLTSLFELIRRG